jgi:hypothetical protein
MGLTSILSIRISAQIKKQTGLDIKTSEILRKPAIRAWANNEANESDVIVKVENKQYYPLTDNQLGVYYDWEMNRDGIQYNIPFAVKFRNIDPEKMLHAVQTAISAHPYLKVHIKNVDGSLVQMRRDGENINVEFKTLNERPDTAFFQTRVKPFNLLGDDLIRAGVYVCAEETYVFIDVHHIIFDGGSMNVFLKSILSAYRGDDIEKEAVSAFDYAAYYDEWKNSDACVKAEEYFENLLHDTSSFTYPQAGNAERSGKSSMLDVEVPLAAIREKCRSIGITENVFFLTIFSLVFHRVSGSKSVQFSMISNGRSLVQLSNTVGMFVQTLPVVSHSETGKVGDIIKFLHKELTDIFQHEKYPFSSLVQKYGVTPNVLFAYQGGVVETSTDDSDLDFVTISLKILDTKVPLQIDIAPLVDSVRIVLTYDNGLYSEKEMDYLLKMAVSYINALIK